MASLESGRVVTCDWSSARQEQCGYSPSVEAPWWDCAAHPPPFTEFTHPGRDISRGIACGSSIRGIAQGLHRCASTISREVARHGGRAQYRANEADQQAWESALRPKPCLLATHTTLRDWCLWIERRLSYEVHLSVGLKVTRRSIPSRILYLPSRQRIVLRTKLASQMKKAKASHTGIKEMPFHKPRRFRP